MQAEESTAAKLQAIWQKCIEANPEKFTEHGIYLTDDYGCCLTCDRNVLEYPYCGGEPTLADVLLVLEAIPEEAEFCYGTLSRKYVFLDSRGMAVSSWNLRQDDLAKQEPATIDFLHSLLS